MHFTRRPLYSLSILLGGSLLLAYFFLVNPPVDRADNVFEAKAPSLEYFNEVHFRDVAEDMGIHYRHQPSTQSPSISVVDINNDGFMDIYVTTGSSEPNLLFINHQGKYFSEEAARYGLADVNRDSPSSYALWADFNGDGVLDLLLAKWGCHRLYLGSGHGKFEQRSDLLGGYCSRPDGVNAADFYGTGRLDLIFANYLPAPGDNSFNEGLWLQSTRYDNRTGGENHLLRNDGTRFVRDSRANFITHSYSHSAGVSDINGDGRPDIFFANDYAHDEMFLNRGEGSFSDVTEEYIPKVMHGMSGMNAEFFDSRNSGKLDLYVSNAYKPPFSRGFNLLWQKQDDGHYKNVSLEVGAARCGFSWAAKFADFDNDGEPDLFVVNGRARDPQLKSQRDGKSMWYERIEVSQIPLFLRGAYRNHGMKGRYISAFERKCLFMQKNGHYYDVAESAGLADLEENRGMALIDFDNDGKMDIVTSGPLAKLKLYHNESDLAANRHWIGFQLRDQNGGVIPHGAIAYLVMKSGRKIMREFYPANGYRGFSDPRLHFGLGGDTEISYLEVHWPLSKAIEIYRDFAVDRYNLIQERSAHAITSTDY